MSVKEILTSLNAPSLANWPNRILRGIEKESLRILPNGQLAQDAHPQSLGSALTNHFITTDFAESLPELITPAVSGMDTLFAQLQAIQTFVHQRLDDQLLWPASMPGTINHEHDIHLTEYGSSNLAKMKHIYRLGLSHRYGRYMQAIAGLHYNFSFPHEFLSAVQNYRGRVFNEWKDAQSDAYMGLIRNFFQHSWLLPYLFGASPACIRTSLHQQQIPLCLATGAGQTLYAPYATALRMSRLGYQNIAQAQLPINYHDVLSYARSLWQATKIPYEPFTKIGVQDEKGNYRQLNDSLLQIENEYYSPIRPKSKKSLTNRPAVALAQHGIEYVEVRVLDLNPFLSLGIDKTQAAFLDVFLTWCLLSDSSDICQADCKEAKMNFQTIVGRGREPDLKLTRCGQEILFQQWAADILSELAEIAQWMDDLQDHNPHYRNAVKQEAEKLSNPLLTPSAQVLEALKKHNWDYDQLILSLAQQHKKSDLAQSLDPQMQSELEKEVQRSQDAQQEIEKNDHLSFEHFLENYFSEDMSL